MKNYSIEITVFVCGAVIMAYEIIGSRMLGPYFGTSFTIWTGIIGIILTSLSLGYYWGGRIADKSPKIRLLALFIFLSALYILVSALGKGYVLNFISSSINNLIVGSLVASVILFSIPSFLLGTVSPFAARIRLSSPEKSGVTVGNLYAISTVGNIIGVFLAGFYLIPNFQLTKILFIFSITLLSISILLNLLVKKNKSLSKTQ